MNSKFVLVSALAAGLMAAAGSAQTTTSQAPAAPATENAPAAAAQPHATPAKIALIEFEQVAAATNEAQKAIAEIQKKYGPQKAQFDARKAEIDSLSKKLQNPPATMGDDEKASIARDIDTKQKQLQRDADDAQNSYASDVQEELAKVEKKLGPIVVKYVQQNGYTMLLDNTGQPQQGGLNILWAPGTDISQAIVDAYNASSGVSAPASSSTTHPHPATATPKPATPKQ